MQIREAISSDIPGILETLKASLGETSSKKTKEVWWFKHIENPFGKSLVLIAEDNNQIVGVRAFMRWKWQKGEKVFSAFRAVDTATHPEYQGRGIFKKLTLKALEIAQEKGDHFVFNTPNEQSRPGYLKMGWEKVDHLKIQLRPANIISFKTRDITYGSNGDPDSIQTLLESYNRNLEASGRLFTPKDQSYIYWRYINNPLQDYIVHFNKDFFIAAYVKNRNWFKEFRVAEVIFSEKGRVDVKSVLLKLARSSGAKVFSLSPDAGLNFKSGITGNFGPVLTYKPINLKDPQLLNLKNWQYSLGDLELF